MEETALLLIDLGKRPHKVVALAVQKHLVDRVRLTGGVLDLQRKPQIFPFQRIQQDIPVVFIQNAPLFKLRTLLHPWHAAVMKIPVQPVRLLFRRIQGKRIYSESAARRKHTPAVKAPPFCAALIAAETVENDKGSAVLSPIINRIQCVTILYKSLIIRHRKL